MIDMDDCNTLEWSVHMLGINNFKIQLSYLYKKIKKKEEYDLVNYNGEDFNREEILELLLKYIVENKDKLSTVEKYYQGNYLLDITFGAFLETYDLEKSLWYYGEECKSLEDSPYQEILNSLL